MKPFTVAIKLIVYMFTASSQWELSVADWLGFLWKTSRYQLATREHEMSFRTSVVDSKVIKMQNHL